MKLRLISSVGYAIVLVGTYVMRELLPAPFNVYAYDAFIYFLTLIGTFEMLRAMGERVTKSERVVVYAFAAVFIPLCSVLSTICNIDAIPIMAVSFFICALALLCQFVIFYKTTNLENVGCALLSAVYPTLLLGVLFLCNHLPKYFDLAILFVFVISPCADTFAFLFGMALHKKFPVKMAPEISPKKTVIGGIGGVIGGLFGGLIIFFSYNLYGVILGGSYNFWQLPIYLIIGALGALATEFGDLVESAIKRKIGIKDMGNIMPGHGGALDRIDGSLFTSIVAYVTLYIYLYLV